jgi:hypothetical protein
MQTINPLQQQRTISFDLVNLASPTAFTGTVSGNRYKTMVGLSNVDDTSDTRT